MRTYLAAMLLVMSSVYSDDCAIHPDANLLKQLQVIPRTASKLSNEELSDVNKKVYQFLQTNEKLSKVDKYILYAYLANAQREFAQLSKKVSGEFSGSFAPITLGIIRLFDSQAALPELHVKADDSYSSALSQKILIWAENRRRKEKEQIHDYPIKKGEEFWVASPDYRGLNLGSIMPWYLSTSSEFRSPPPPSDAIFWQQQIEQIKQAMSTLDSKKREAIVYWAERGNWEEIAEKYMQLMNTPMEKRLSVRAVLISVIADATSAVFDAKYTYWIKRPFMMDPSIQSVIPVPSHPSYPGAHAVIAQAASDVLKAFFPENQRGWQLLSTQSGLSRIWAGIHFPIDIEAGNAMGKKVAQKALQNESLANGTF